MNDPQTGATRTLTIIGVLRDSASAASMLGISTSQRSAAAAYGDRSPPTFHFIKLASGVDAKRTAKALESAFLANGMQASATQEERCAGLPYDAGLGGDALRRAVADAGSRVRSRLRRLFAALLPAGRHLGAEALRYE